jgi:hypothetical protein
MSRFLTIDVRIGHVAISPVQASPTPGPLPTRSNKIYSDHRGAPVQTLKMSTPADLGDLFAEDDLRHRRQATVPAFVELL